MAAEDPITLEHRQFVEQCCASLGIPREMFFSDARHTWIARARHIIAWSVRQRFGLSYPKVALLSGRTNHTTAMHSVAIAAEALEREEPWAVEIVARLRTRREQAELPLESPLESLRYCRIELDGRAIVLEGNELEIAI